MSKPFVCSVAHVPAGRCELHYIPSIKTVQNVGKVITQEWCLIRHGIKTYIDCEERQADTIKRSDIRVDLLFPPQSKKFHAKVSSGTDIEFT